ncbi:carboxypeptidase B-like [Penaeus indicus]|uniref:carboxypeptidase B-like n=1 Tax=Penaeus indicus TaxID=29960 RepID=UPI00300D56EC
MRLWQGLCQLVLAAAALGQHAGPVADHAYAGWVELEVMSSTPLAVLENLGRPGHVNFLGFAREKGATVFAVSQDELLHFAQKLAGAGVVFQIQSRDLSQLMLTPLRYSQKGELPKGNVTFDRYMNYEEILSYVEELPSKHTDRVNLEELGRSVEGRPIYLITINRNNNSRRTEKPVIFIEAGAHAREWVSPAAALYLMERLLESPSLLRNAEWRVVPLLNPDGYVYSWNHDRLWRKNRAPLSDPECFGVDLNRNFAYHWGEVGGSIKPCSSVYQGPQPFSEPETQALRDAVFEVQNRTKAYVSLHSYGQVFLYPWGYTTTLNHSNTEELVAIAEGMARKIKSANYTISGSTSTFLIAGASDDWVASLGVPFVYTMELRDTGKSAFHLPEELIVSSGEDLWAAMKYLGRQLEKKKKKHRGTRN